MNCATLVIAQDVRFVSAEVLKFIWNMEKSAEGGVDGAEGVVGVGTDTFQHGDDNYGYQYNNQTILNNGLPP